MSGRKPSKYLSVFVLALLAGAFGALGKKKVFLLRLCNKDRLRNKIFNLGYSRFVLISSTRSANRHTNCRGFSSGIVGFFFMFTEALTVPF